MQQMRLRSFEFRKEREEAWRELERLISRVEKRGLSSLSADEVARLPELYRAALSSRSVARSISLDKNLIEYLEGLARRAYVTVYSTRRRLRRALSEFYRRRFPAMVWGMRRNLLVSAILMVLGVAAGLVLTLAEPDRFYSFVDSAMSQGRGPLSSREELQEVLTNEGGGAGAALMTFATFLFTHNAKIGLLCFALGFAAGAPVLFLVFVNGLILGAFAAIHIARDLGVEFWAWVLPHGVTELLAVCICAAAGLTIAEGMIFPGGLRRIDNLMKKGREAAGVVVGTILLFFLAALIEGLFRQLVHTVSIRLMVAAMTAFFWGWYFFWHARRVTA